MNTTTDFRQYLRSAGEPLLMPVDALEVCTRAATFITDSRSDDAQGFTASDLWIEPSLGHPIPRYDVGDDGELLPWEGIAPSLLWHPLLWLPKRVALPARFEFDDGSVEVETMSEWAIRVMLECLQVGLWDVDRGWADVWSIAGVDAEEADFHDRVVAWQAGGKDRELDAVSLASVFDDADESGGIYRKARSLAAAVQPVAIGTHARTLADVAHGVDRDSDAGALVASVATIAGAALVALGDDDDDDAAQIAELYARALEEDADAATLLAELAELLDTIAADHQGSVDEARSILAA